MVEALRESEDGTNPSEAGDYTERQAAKEGKGQSRDSCHSYPASLCLASLGEFLFLKASLSRPMPRTGAECGLCLYPNLALVCVPHLEARPLQVFEVKP